MGDGLEIRGNVDEGYRWQGGPPSSGVEPLDFYYSSQRTANAEPYAGARDQENKQTVRVLTCTETCKLGRHIN